MPEDPLPPSPETPPPGAARRRGTGPAGESTLPTSEAGYPAGPGPSVRPGAAQPVSEIIGDFEVVGRLGAGGMGAVYRARQISLGRTVALKVLPAQFIEDPDAVNRFQREARVAARLSHPNLVRIYSAGVADGCHYIAMELIEGEDLGVRLKREGKLVAPEALRIIADVVRGLQYGWQQAQLVHRDIKPGNVFLSHEGMVKVGDLGLAKLLDSSTTGLTQTGTMMGTPHYISPEQARGDREIDFRADIYSLGCTLFHLLTGQTPYHGTEAISLIRQHLDAPVPAILKVWPQCPIPLGRLVSRMLKKSRHERQASYDELITQIESVWAQIDPAGYAPEAFAPTKPPDPNATQIAAPAVAALSPASHSSPSGPQFGTDGDAGTAPLQKSKLPLYIGIAAGVAVLGIAAFLFWPREEKLTRAQIYAREHAGEHNAVAGATGPGGEADPGGRASGKPASTTGVTSAPVASTAGLTLPATGWKPMVSNPQGALTGPAWSGFQDGWYRSPGIHLKDPYRDVIVHGHVRLVRDGKAEITLRGANRADHSAIGYHAGFAADGTTLRLLKTVKTGTDGHDVPSETRALGHWSLPQPLAAGDEFDLAFAAVGGELAVWFNGQRVITARDDALAEGEIYAGSLGTLTEMKDMEWQER